MSTFHGTENRLVARYCRFKDKVRGLPTRLNLIFLIVTIAGLAFSVSCLRSSEVSRDANITLYCFSVVKEPIEQDISPAFKAEWLKKTGQQLEIVGSYAASEVVTGQVRQDDGIELGQLGRGQRRFGQPARDHSPLPR